MRGIWCVKLGGNRLLRTRTHYATHSVLSLFLAFTRPYTSLIRTFSRVEGTNPLWRHKTSSSLNDWTKRIFVLKLEIWEFSRVQNPNNVHIHIIFILWSRKQDVNVPNDVSGIPTSHISAVCRNWMCALSYKQNINQNHVYALFKYTWVKNINHKPKKRNKPSTTNHKHNQHKT